MDKSDFFLSLFVHVAEGELNLFPQPQITFFDPDGMTRSHDESKEWSCIFAFRRVL